MTARTKRGRETELMVARHWQERGFPYCEPVGAGAGGADLTGTPGIAVEIKARTDFNPRGWIKQAVKNAGFALPTVILRCNGQGQKDIDDWVVVLRHRDFLDLLRDAGWTDA